MNSANEDEKLSEKSPKSPGEETASVEESCPFAVTAYENAVKPNVKVCVLYHVGGVACDELKGVNLCPLSETGTSKESINRRVTA